VRRLLLTLLIATLAVLVLAGAADARRRATKAESKAMWKAVPSAASCVHRRGWVSTVRRPKFVYGAVVVSDANCGDGSYILRRARGKHVWRKIGHYGSEHACSEAPTEVVVDLFGFCYAG
jgi:hypothetical protein